MGNNSYLLIHKLYLFVCFLEILSYVMGLTKSDSMYIVTLIIIFTTVFANFSAGNSSYFLIHKLYLFVYFLEILSLVISSIKSDSMCILSHGNLEAYQ